MRVALIDPSLFTLPYDRMLAGGLAEIGHEVVLYGRRPAPDDGSAEGVDIDPLFYPLSSGQMGSRLPSKLRLGLKGLEHISSLVALGRRFAEAGRRPDVIHFQWLPLPMVDRLFLGRFHRIAPLVLTVHDTNAFNGDPSAVLQRVGVAESFASFDRLIIHTAQGRERLVSQGVPGDRVAQVPHGLLDPPAVVGSGAEEQDPMSGALTFLLFGKIKPYKGADLLIEAFAGLPAPLRAAARIRIIGKPYMDLGPLRALAEKLQVEDRVLIEPRFVPDEEVASLFGPGVVAVFPYREIEASGVLALAIAYGRPVIASRLGGFSEVVTDGVHGRLLEPGKVDELRGALENVLSARPLAASYAAAVRRLASDIPSWADIARRTERVYQEATEVRRRGVGASGALLERSATARHAERG